jgi:DNA-binding MarR family transcriptional regulator
MNNKTKPLKQSEARILMYLNNVVPKFKFPRAISAKLGMDKAYLSSRLGDMIEKGWLIKEKYPLRTYYNVTDKAPIDEAREVLK